MNGKQFNRTKYACFITSFSTAITGNLTPVLFLTFRNLYGFSYTFLAFLTVINFATQLVFDILFSFCAEKLPQKKCLKIMPVIMTVGFILFGATPLILPNHIVLGILISTVIFSAGSGLSEVLCSPTIAAIPADDNGKLVSRLHSCYAWGLVFVVAATTLFLHFFGNENWYIIAILFAILPFIASVLFVGADTPDTKLSEEDKNSENIFRNGALWLCVICIFFGGAAECCMSCWCSGFAEQSLGIDKIWGDIFGVAMFGVTLGLGRTLYSKFGRNIYSVLIGGSLLAVLCYAVAVLSPLPVLGLIACAMTGFCVSMLWPGTLVAASELIPKGGVGMYALMAAGGDLGAAVCPQIVGIIADKVVATEGIVDIAAKFSLTADGFAMKIGIACSVICPIAAVIFFTLLTRKAKKIKNYKK